MSYMRSWVVVSKDSGKIYGPFSSADLASKWAVANMRNVGWHIERLRK